MFDVDRRSTMWNRKTMVFFIWWLIMTAHEIVWCLIMVVCINKQESSRNTITCKGHSIIRRLCLHLMQLSLNNMHVTSEAHANNMQALDHMQSQSHRHTIERWPCTCMHSRIQSMLHKTLSITLAWSLKCWKAKCGCARDSFRNSNTTDGSAGDLPNYALGLKR